jgi:hypothetical protein
MRDRRQKERERKRESKKIEERKRLNRVEEADKDRCIPRGIHSLARPGYSER